MADVSLEVVQSQLQGMAEDMRYVRESVHDLRNSIQVDRDKLTRLEERHLNHAAALERVFTMLGAIDNRCKQMELNEPTTKLVTRVVISGAIGVLAIVGGQWFAVMKSAERPVQVVIDKDVIERVSRSQP